MTSDEARENLRISRQVMEQTRRSIAVAGAGHIMVIWGVVWLLGFSSSQFLRGPVAGWAWLALELLGAVATLVVGHRLGIRMRVCPGWRIGLFWLALFCYTFIWRWVLQPRD